MPISIIANHRTTHRLWRASWLCCALAGCGGGHDGATATPDATPVDAAPVDGDPFGDGPRVPLALRALHSPGFASAHHDRDPDALVLRVNGTAVPPLGAYIDPDTGIPDLAGRVWTVPLAGDAALSIRRGDAPDAEVASDQLAMSPVILDEPLISATAYAEYGLPPYLAFVTGATGAYHAGHIAVSYDPTAAQRWRLNVVNGRVDSAISARVVEIDDDLNLVANGYSQVLFEHLAAGAALGNVEVVSPRVRVGLLVSADLHPTSEVTRSALTYPNPWPDHLALGQNLPVPDGTILTLLVSASLPSDAATLVNWELDATAWSCRDPRYKPIILDEASNDPKACWGPVWGPGHTTAPTQGASAVWHTTSGAR